MVIRSQIRKTLELPKCHLASKFTYKITGDPDSPQAPHFAIYMIPKVKESP